MNKQSLLHFNGVGVLAVLGLGVMALVPNARAESLWNKQHSRALVADRRAAHVGDILHIVVQENSTATKNNSTKTSKGTALDANIAAFLFSPDASGLLTQGGKMPAIKLDAKHEFEGGGNINNSERIVARIAVRVVDELPNRNLVIEGRRLTSFGGERQEVILRGVVRPDDITPNNTVFSYNVADASVQILSHGPVSETQRKGWFTRLWEKVTPF